MSIERLQLGTDLQQQAYSAIQKLNVMNDFKEYAPTLCGTFPIDIYTASSDLDIIMEVHDHQLFYQKLTSFYKHMESFLIKQKEINGSYVTKVNFQFQNFAFELFGQAIPVKKQRAYEHMLVEQYVLTTNPAVKEQILSLKAKGIKTEPAFAQILGLKGDPYISLLEFGQQKGII
ncbi:DUF4269 domain-containing protein [Alkalihalobacterium bogoriense]|uniref:DUF4269 domain-containing protein n=1 Tax=Alkalihalobacterium bogoriense TaxID=246272 RepID=UPI00047ACD4B|nr:DUF4269 domain-containing protein [Alkalihalobacterium bogoriense]